MLSIKVNFIHLALEIKNSYPSSLHQWLPSVNVLQKFLVVKNVVWDGGGMGENALGSVAGEMTLIQCLVTDTFL